VANQDLKSLPLTFSGRTIQHLGMDLYQSPVSAIAEMVANAWDADASNVSITLPSALDDLAQIEIRDDGIGMGAEELINHYLTVGWSCRGDDPDAHSGERNRPLLGRKGIGKFAGFGIAGIIRVETISKLTGEKTVFEISANKVLTDAYADEEIPVEEYRGPSEERKEQHGTSVVLKSLTLDRKLSPAVYARSMARRFLLHQQADEFRVLVNNEPLPESEDMTGVQFSFPRDYQDGEKPANLRIGEDGWGEEELPGGDTIRWRIHFHEETIDEEELRGVSVFTGIKLAQAPFFFNLSGGLGGQHGQQYMSGRVQADYIDKYEKDLIATERQRINWEHPGGEALEAWGQQRTKKLLKIWQERRADRRVSELDRKVAGFSDRLDRLSPREARTVKQSLLKLAQVPTLSTKQFEELGGGVITAWESGRLRELIGEIAEAESLSESALVNILMEAGVMTALNTAEAVKTKLLAIGGLKVRIQNRELENAVRDYIAENPWMISPEWETFAKERSVRNVLVDAAIEAGLDDEKYRGRVDLALASGSQLLVLEFVRPGLAVDWDHIDRFERYVRIIRVRMAANTGGRFKSVTGYIVADTLDKEGAITSKVESLADEGMLALEWETLFEKALAAWKEFLHILVGRAPEDERLKVLLQD
jgi:hypothetical protein